MVAALSNEGCRAGRREQERGLEIEAVRAALIAPGGISDATIPLPQLTTYAPACGHENKINFLTLPQSPDLLAIFGGGYAIDLLRALPWIANQPHHNGAISTRMASPS